VRQARGRQDSSFCEQKEAKKLYSLVGGFSGSVGFCGGGILWLRRFVSHLSGQAAKPTNKVFLLLFFQKKKTLPSLPVSSEHAA
jgi:nitrate reductase gamma subunit